MNFSCQVDLFQITYHRQYLSLAVIPHIPGQN
jgi:hypothetical protein